MSGKYSWKELAGTAKKWVDSKVIETTTADRRTRERAEGNQTQIERELEQQAGGAVLTTLFPGFGRALDRQDDHRVRAARERAERDRADRAASLRPGSSVDLDGAINGHVEGLAVRITTDDEERTLLVLLETVDPVTLDGGELWAAGFAIAGFHGDGTYPLVPYIESLDPGVHHVVLNGGDDESDWYYWSDESGPARAVVAGGLVTLTMTCRNCMGADVTVTLRVPTR